MEQSLAHGMDIGSPDTQLGLANQFVNEFTAFELAFGHV
jgi:hypothetical protein